MRTPLRSAIPGVMDANARTARLAGTLAAAAVGDAPLTA
jgi:hypothetical protein